jgi:putative cardiolipin synthase
MQHGINKSSGMSLRAWADRMLRATGLARGLTRRPALLRALLALPLLVSCAALPHHAEPRSFAIAAGSETPLQRVAITSTQGFAESGFQLLPVATASLEARLALVARAEKSLDLQYFEWAEDATGRYLIRALRLAAERGVRVRVLVDDLHDDGADKLLSGLAACGNVQVRLFNPFVRFRDSLAFKLASSLDDLDRVNHRMHNKMFVADNALAVFGGRNIADEYFMRSAERNFVDLDMLAAGPIVQELSASFDVYWNSNFVYSIDAVVQPAAGSPEQRCEALTATVAATGPPPVDRTVPPRFARYSQVPTDLEEGRLRMVAAHAELRVDPVDKASGTRLNDRHGTVRAFVGEFTRAAQSEVVAVSPYFVPGELGMETIEMLSRRGVRMRVLTNSLAATDEPVVYGGYLRYVIPMMRLGLELYELSPNLVRQSRLGRFGNSQGMLHAKILIVDRARVFVGSLNIDGRSERYNTEIGLLIDSPEMAAELLDMLDFGNSSYRLRLTSDGERVEWVSGSEENQQVYDKEPEADRWTEFKAHVLGKLLPENWL